MGKRITHKKISERMYVILDQLGKIYLTSILYAPYFQKFCIMLIVKWCNVQTREYDLRAFPASI